MAGVNSRAADYTTRAPANKRRGMGLATKSGKEKAGEVGMAGEKRIWRFGCRGPHSHRLTRWSLVMCLCHYLKFTVFRHYVSSLDQVRSRPSMFGIQQLVCFDFYRTRALFISVTKVEWMLWVFFCELCPTKMSTVWISNRDTSLVISVSI